MDSHERQKLRYLDPEIIQKIGSLDLVAREVVEGLRVGVHKSPLRGFSTEFVHHRQYVPGDNLRHLDWRVYGRTGRYYVKLFEAETNFDAVLLLDASTSMEYSSGKTSKLEYAKFMAASLAYLIVQQRDSAGLAVFDDAIRQYIHPKGASSTIRDIAHELEKAAPQPKTNIAAQLHELAMRMRRRGLVMLFSDLFDNVEDFVKGLDHLRFCGHNVTVFHMLDPAELNFPFDGTWRFMGLEAPDEILTEPRRIRAAYLEELDKFLTQVRRACERSKIDYVLVDTSRPIDEVLSAYLIGQIRSTQK
ncbi:MAG: DUF58 domain-containing protein [Planctomycetaceae bacterium]|nr:DUF58 domain-containing protein [Planctomycetaceae bacterium]